MMTNNKQFSQIIETERAADVLNCYNMVRERAVGDIFLVNRGGILYLRHTTMGKENKNLTRYTLENSTFEGWRMSLCRNKVVLTVYFPDRDYGGPEACRAAAAALRDTILERMQNEPGGSVLREYRRKFKKERARASKRRQKKAKEVARKRARERRAAARAAREAEKDTELRVAE